MYRTRSDGVLLSDDEIARLTLSNQRPDWTRAENIRYSRKVAMGNMELPSYGSVLYILSRMFYAFGGTFWMHFPKPADLMDHSAACTGVGVLRFHLQSKNISSIDTKLQL